MHLTSAARDILYNLRPAPLKEYFTEEGGSYTARVLNHLNAVLLQGQSSIINLLQHVGPNQTNSPDDVKVVQELLQMIAKGSEWVASVGVPNLTGQFDSCTGF